MNPKHPLQQQYLRAARSYYQQELGSLRVQLEGAIFPEARERIQAEIDRLNEKYANLINPPTPKKGG